ncbi:MAG: cobalamin B12-binding domain-containing protein [Dehalococcoidia bacterium]
MASTKTNEKREHIRVLMAKPGFDGHWRGATVVSLALRDAGMDVIYTGNLPPEEIVEAAIQEDVDVIGLSILAAGHMKLISEVIQLLRDKGVTDTLVVVGGTIPQEDIPKLKEMGVAEVFHPGSRLEAIVDYVRNNACRGGNPSIPQKQRPSK